jgi:ATP-dependent Lon protease
MRDKFLFNPEDDMDFIPIIPLNEHDAENSQDVEIGEELPILPLRNTVLFPGVVLPITVGRDKSIKAINEAYKTDKLIGVVAQKNSDIEGQNHQADQNARWGYYRNYSGQKKD